MSSTPLSCPPQVGLILWGGRSSHPYAGCPPPQISPWDPEAKELRAECHLHLGDPTKAILDLKPTTKLRSDNRAAFLKLSRLYYRLGEHEEALA